MSRSLEKKDQPGITKENHSALNTRSRTNDKQSEESTTKKKEGKGILEKVKDKTKAFITGAPPIVTPDSTSRVDSQFSPNDRVVVRTDSEREKPIYGTVRWVGSVKTSSEDVVPVVGIETVS